MSHSAMSLNKLFSFSLACFVLSVSLAFSEEPPGGIPALPGFTQDAAQTQSPAKETAKPAQAPAKSGEGTGAVGEFVIKGESKLSVDSEKPSLKFAVDQDKALESYLETEKELFLKSPPQIADIKEQAPVRQSSAYLVTPRFTEFRQDAIAHEFHPAASLEKIFREPDIKRAENFAHWDFKVADAHGRIFYNRTGKGLPPENVAINTVNEKGETIRVGSPYSGILSYWDSYGSLHTVICESFNLSGLIQKGGKGYTLYLAPGSLFGDKDSSEITPEGKKLLRETADWIKLRRSAQAPLGIQVFSKNTTLAKAQSESLTENLIRLLKRPKNSLVPVGKTAASGVDQYIEISIFSAD